MKAAANHQASVESFYHLADAALDGHACRGMACFAARHDAPDRWQRAQLNPPLYCLGQCYRAPAMAGEDARPHIAVYARETVLLGNVLGGGVRSLARYQQTGGGLALQQALTMPQETLLDVVARSGLRGRGGAGFPAGKKWQAVAAAKAPHKYVVANADEGDPGAFSDRFLMEDDPFRLLEALIIAGITVGAEQGYIYLRKEYPAAAAVLHNALQQAREAGWLGDAVMGSAHRFALELVIGQGSYVCGEETALLNALEGRRPEARLRPPQITAQGLFGCPTLVNNVETLHAIPWIISRGAEAYAALGAAQSRGTKLVSLNSLFRRPGLYEVEFGISLRKIVEELGGGLRRGQLLGLMVGGPLAGLVPPSLLDTPLGYEEMQTIGAAVGHGGVIAFADDTSIAELLAEVFRFGAQESCGKCVPCLMGTPRLAHLFQAVNDGRLINATEVDELIAALGETSLCGHGRGLAEFARAIKRHYPREWTACFG